MIKYLMTALILALSLFSQPVFAASQTAAYVRIQLHSANVASTSYTEIMSSTARAVKGITVFSTSQNPVEIAVGGAGSEVAHLLAPAGTLSSIEFNGAPVGTYTGQTNFFPVSIALGRRLAVRCLRSPCTTGELQVNILYN
jgi:hypothetical protein